MDEDIYSQNLLGIADFINETCCILDSCRRMFTYSTSEDSPRVELRHLRAFLRMKPRQTVEGRYSQNGSSPDIRLLQNAITTCPAKVARINKCIQVINECKTMTVFKMACNEMQRLLYGKNLPLPFRGKRYDPDKLDL